MKYLLIFLLLFTFFCVEVHSSDNHLFIKNDELFTNASHRSGQLSPSGKYFSYILQNTEDAYLEFVDISERTSFPVAAIGKGTRLLSYEWLNDELLFLSTRNIRGRSKQTLLSFNLTEGQLNTESFVLETGYLVNSLPNEPNKVLFAKMPKYYASGQQTLYKIDVEALKNNEFSDADIVDRSPDGLFRYRYDLGFSRIMAVFYSEEDKQTQIKYRGISENSWKLVTTIKREEYRLSPVGFVDDNYLAVLTNKETDTIVLQKLNINTQSLEDIIYEHANYDLTGALMSEEGDVLAVEYFQSGLPQREWLSKRSNNIVERLKVSFDNSSPRIIDSSEEIKRLLIFAIGGDNPGEYFVYDYLEDAMTKMVSSFPKLDKYRFSAAKAFKVTTGNGEQIEALLTEPKGLDLNTLLVKPHGGPVGVRDSDLFDREVQFLVNRGFTVLRVNFRGSEGYGKSFKESGKGQFGQLIEQDISLVVDSVLQNNDYDNVCAIGSSYGAYSSMVLASKHPEIYDCVIGSFGIYDVPLLFSAGNFYSTEEFREKVTNVVGENKPENKDISPVYQIDQLNVPILLVAGQEDKVAHYEHSTRMNYMLKKHNKDVTFVSYKQSGHGHRVWIADQHEAAASVDFLYNKLNLDISSVARSSASNKDAIGYDYTLMSQFLQNGRYIEKDAERASYYASKGSELNSTEGNYAMGLRYLSGDGLDADHKKGVSLLEKAIETGHVEAHFRLGKIYMNGHFAPKQDMKALSLLEFALEQEDIFEHKLALAQLNCVATDEAIKNFSECMSRFDKLSSEVTNRKEADVFNEYLLRAFLYEGYMSDERAKFNDFVKETYSLDDSEHTLVIQEAGFFQYNRSPVFGRRGTFDFLYAPTAQKLKELKEENDIYMGVKFELDEGSFFGTNRKTMIAIKWEKYDASGQLIKVMFELDLGRLKEDWLDYIKLGDVEAGAEYKLTIFGTKSEILHSQSFVI